MEMQEIDLNKIEEQTLSLVKAMFAEKRTAAATSTDLTDKGKKTVGDVPFAELTAREQAMALASGLAKAAIPEATIDAQEDRERQIRKNLSTARFGSPRGDGDPANVKNFKHELIDYVVEGKPHASEADKAMHMMRRKLQDVDSAKYKLISYDPNTGKMQASAQKPDGLWVGVGQSKTGNPGYNNPGSLSWKIKTIIKGEPEEVIVAS
jgi:hypothetical protein